MATADARHRSLAGFIGANGGLPAAPVNTVAPSITGTMTVGETVTAASGTWTGRAAPTFTRQWRRDGVAIPGATGATYVLAAPDSGTTITVAVTGTNWSGSATAVSAGRAVA